MTVPTNPGRRRMPLHPPLVHIPIGALLSAAVLDVVSALSGTGHGSARDLYRAGTWVLIIGTTVMFVAALAGLADRSGTTEPGSSARRAANRHAAVMTVVLLLSVVDLVLRRQHYAAAGSTPAAVLVLEAFAVVLTIVGGHAGGRLVHRWSQDTDHGAAVSAPAGTFEEPAAR
jgi:uncharacterized membrane protein